jgi:hypothetical protein
VARSLKGTRVSFGRFKVSQKHDICITDHTGKTIKEFQITHNVEGFTKFDHQLNIYDKNHTLICIETNSGLFDSENEQGLQKGQVLLHICYRVLLKNLFQLQKIIFSFYCIHFLNIKQFPSYCWQTFNAFNTQ